VDDDYIVGALLLDLSKAFDLIDHELLLKKMQMQLDFGVHGNAEECFRIYLLWKVPRSIWVGQATSCWQTPRFGVPQGSILRLLMFIRFVNDLPQAIRRGSMNMYADDTTLHTAAKTIEETNDMLRTDAQSTLDWYK